MKSFVGSGLGECGDFSGKFRIRKYWGKLAGAKVGIAGDDDSALVDDEDEDTGRNELVRLQKVHERSFHQGFVQQ